LSGKIRQVDNPQRFGFAQERNIGRIKSKFADLLLCGIKQFVVNIDFFIKEMLERDNILPEDERYADEYERLYNKYKGKIVRNKSYSTKL